MSKLILGEGKPTDKTLGELVGHVVMFPDNPNHYFVAGEQYGRVLCVGILGCDIQSRVEWDERVEKDFDLIELATDEPAVCMPRMKMEDAGGGYLYVYLGDERVSKPVGWVEAHTINTALKRALSSLPTVDEVRREASD